MRRALAVGIINHNEKYWKSSGRFRYTYISTLKDTCWVIFGVATDLTSFLMLTVTVFIGGAVIYISQDNWSFYIFSFPYNQSTNQSINRAINQSINQSIDRAIELSINQSIELSPNQSIYRASNPIDQTNNQSINWSSPSGIFECFFKILRLTKNYLRKLT